MFDSHDWRQNSVRKTLLLSAALGFVFLLQVYNFFTVVVATGFFVFAVAFLRPSIHSLTSQRATLGQGASLGWRFEHLRRMLEHLDGQISGGPGCRSDMESPHDRSIRL